MKFLQLTDFAIGLKGIAELSSDGVKVSDPGKFRGIVDELVYSAVFAPDEDVRDTAKWIVWEAAHELGAVSASINDLYFTRGQKKYRDLCVPAVNIRTMTFEVARALFRAVAEMNGGPFIFEVAKSEMGYTGQRPSEYVTSILGAAIKEGYTGPVCIQGDHFQVNLKKYKEDPDKEVNGVKELIEEAIAAGFYNIDIDTSTLVDLDKPTIKEQQYLNYDIAARMTEHIRKHEPEGINVSVGGEIGEVGKKNSTVEELDAYFEGYNETLAGLSADYPGISKISIQTGTSHGGVPLADGSVAEVALDFGVLEELGEAARQKYNIGGVVQHGASTLPDEAFNRFKETQTTEVHLATGFQNLILDHERFPPEDTERIQSWLKVNCAKERKEDQTLEQFLYKTRKKVFGPFKPVFWNLPKDIHEAIMKDMQAKFSFLFDQLGLPGTRDIAMEYIAKPRVRHEIPKVFSELLENPDLFGETRGAEEDAPGAD